MPRRILLIRRDNIGDLILTTPLIRTLRQAMPDAQIDALVTSYNAPVLEGNPDLNNVYAYTKGKHADGSLEVLRARALQARLFWRLRHVKYDDVVLAELGYLPRNLRLAHFVLAHRTGTRVIGFKHDNGSSAGLDIVIGRANTDSYLQTQLIFLLAAAYGIGTPIDQIPPCRVYPSPHAPHAPPPTQQSIALHISARKPSQRWSAASFIALAGMIHRTTKARILLFWSPGDEDDPLHPGDDRKAATILRALNADAAARAINVTPVPTAILRDLIDQLNQASLVVCADGGALHVAAGLGKPIVALFGDSEIKRWRPWAVPHVVLQAPSRHVDDISPVEVMAAIAQLSNGVS